MLSIFQKKEFLIDHLQGITDIHNHLLPGIDDGAANLEESIKLIRLMRKMGISNFIATPHIMNDYYPNTPETIDRALTELKNKLAETPELNEVKITAAAEYMMDQHLLDLLEEDKLLVLKENLVLVEMSYFQPPINLKEILFRLQTKGYKPVLAHPERYAFYHTADLAKYEDLKNRGCLFQINALSLTSHYGRNMEKIALKLLKKGMIDFIGSDTHREQHLEKLSGIKLNTRIMNQVKQVISRTKSTF